MESSEIGSRVREQLGDVDQAVLMLGKLKCMLGCSQSGDCGSDRYLVGLRMDCGSGCMVSIQVRGVWSVSSGW